MLIRKLVPLFLLAIGCYASPHHSNDAQLDVLLERFHLENPLVPSRSLDEVKSLRAKYPEPLSQHPDVGLTVVELITKYGYPVESHEVETEDGYILTVHRIPHGKNNSEIQNRQVVFLQHGLLCSSADWVLMGPEKGLAYILADRGYDVFMGNARGNTWSRKHKKYSPDKNKKEFWDFSWHDIGYYDLAAMIDFTIEKSGQEKIFYVGHSQGTTAFFVLMSQRPEYNEKIHLMSALSPIAFMGNVPNLFFKFLAYFEGLASVLGDLIGVYEFLPSSKLMQQIGQVLCNDEAIFQEVCANILFLITGFNSEQLNRTMIPVILSNTPAGASTKQLFHYAQGMKSGQFRLYDYGLFGNWGRYGTWSPPSYDLSKITTEIALFYGDNDSLADVDDIKTLYRSLQNVVMLKNIKSFNHLDFLWAIDAPTMLYKYVISLIERQ